MPTSANENPKRTRRGRPGGTVERRLPVEILRQATEQLRVIPAASVASIYRELRIAEYGVPRRTFHLWSTRLRRRHFGQPPIKFRGSAAAGLTAQRKAIALLSYLAEGERPDFIPLIVREMARIARVRLRGEE